MRTTVSFLFVFFSVFITGAFGFILPKDSSSLPSITSITSERVGRAHLVLFNAESDSTEKTLSRKENSSKKVEALLKSLGELDDEDDENSSKKKKKSKKGKVGGLEGLKNEKNKLEAEVTFYEGAPSPTEMIIPGISILTVIGLLPFAASVARQIWTRYKVTSRRVSVTSGVGGKDVTEVIYPDIERVTYVFRMFGTSGDMCLFLRDGAKLEIRSVSNFVDVYNYIRERIDDDAKSKTEELPAWTKKDNQETPAE